MSIYSGNRNWKSLNDIVPVARQEVPGAPGRDGGGADWSHARKAQPAETLLPHAEKWFDALPPESAPCALATQFPRIVNLIVSQWNDRRGAPLLFEDLLHDRRGGRAGFPPAVRRDLLMLQELWYRGAAGPR